MSKKNSIVREAGAEEKIKEAAKKVFLAKGYAATRTRDIAEEAGLNLALLNYYFRSKENLFHVVMIEKLQLFFNSMIAVFSNKNMSLDEKIDAFVDRYITVIIQNPDLPIFIMSELHQRPQEFLKEMKVREVIQQSGLLLQIQERVKQSKGNMSAVHPIHFIMNITSLCVFPFIAKPIFQSLSGMEQEAFIALMEQRKKLVPIWVKQMLGG